jgi:hypothetical protein
MEKFTAISRNLLIGTVVLLLLNCDVTFWHIIPQQPQKLGRVAFQQGLMLTVVAFVLGLLRLPTHGRSRARLLVCVAAAAILIAYATAYAIEVRFSHASGTSTI